MGVGKGEGGKREILASMSITFHGKPDIAGLGFGGGELGEQVKDRRTRMKTLPERPPSG